MPAATQIPPAHLPTRHLTGHDRMGASLIAERGRGRSSANPVIGAGGSDAPGENFGGIAEAMASQWSPDIEAVAA